MDIEIWIQIFVGLNCNLWEFIWHFSVTEHIILLECCRNNVINGTGTWNQRTSVLMMTSKERETCEQNMQGINVVVICHSHIIITTSDSYHFHTEVNQSITFRRQWSVSVHLNSKKQLLLLFTLDHLYDHQCVEIGVM